MSAPDTIVLVHGLWLTAASWQPWIERYEARGFKVLAPSYPGLDKTPAELNADPSAIEALTMPDVVESYETIIGALDAPPIIIGHSQGGVITQVLLDHGHGAAGVAISSVPTEGVTVLPLSQIKATFPILSHPSTRHQAVPLTAEQFHYAFTNTLDAEAAAQAYAEQAIPAPGPMIWGGVLGNFKPGHQEHWVDYKNDDRAPLLFISGGQDHIMPPAVQKSNLKHYKGDTVTELREFADRSHYICSEPGWEEVADLALDWALEHAAPAPAAAE